MTAPAVIADAAARRAVALARQPHRLLGPMLTSSDPTIVAEAHAYLSKRGSQTGTTLRLAWNEERQTPRFASGLFAASLLLAVQASSAACLKLSSADTFAVLAVLLLSISSIVLWNVWRRKQKRLAALSVALARYEHANALETLLKTWIFCGGEQGATVAQPLAVVSFPLLAHAMQQPRFQLSDSTAQRIRTALIKRLRRERRAHANLIAGCDLLEDEAEFLLCLVRLFARTATPLEFDALQKAVVTVPANKRRRTPLPGISPNYETVQEAAQTVSAPPPPLRERITLRQTPTTLTSSPPPTQSLGIRRL